MGNQQKTGVRQPWSGRPPSSEIAAYGRLHVTCRNCGAKPDFPCTEQAEAYRTVCSARFADAAAEYIPAWKDARGRPAADR